MSTDPFASPPEGAAAPAPQAHPGTAPAYAPEHTAAPQAFVPPGGSPVGQHLAALGPPQGPPLAHPVAPPVPTTPSLEVSGHARWAKVGAFSAAVAGLCLAAFNYLVAVAADDDLAAALVITALFGVAFMGALTGYLTLCLWMIRVRDIVKPQGYPAPESWKIWAGWFIPLYSLVAPLRAMDKLAFKAGKERMTPFLTLWWGGFLVTNIASRLTDITSIEASIVLVLTAVEAVAALVSLAGLLVLIARISTVATTPPPGQALPSAPPTGAALQHGPAALQQQPPAGFTS